MTTEIEALQIEALQIEALQIEALQIEALQIEALKEEVKKLRHRVWSVERSLCERWHLRGELEVLLGVEKVHLDDQLPIAIAEIKRLMETERKILDRDALTSYLENNSTILQCPVVADAVIAYVKEGER